VEGCLAEPVLRITLPLPAWDGQEDPKLTPEQLDCIAEHLIQKALAGQPKEVVDAARRRIEAGEPVTIEQLTQDLAEGSAGEPKS
jgi:hypothetical protein